jgi:hypothetical protein
MSVVPSDFWLLVGSEDSCEELRHLPEAAMDGTPKKEKSIRGKHGEYHITFGFGSRWRDYRSSPNQKFESGF